MSQPRRSSRTPKSGRTPRASLGVVTPRRNKPNPPPEQPPDPPPASGDSSALTLCLTCHKPVALCTCGYQGAS